ncbi:MAG: hypothetical protein JJ863_25980 [Deltaproteobacteria bacterium]|nr:hypothetical protein [Deltaproteobacteria bacterium]
MAHTIERDGRLVLVRFVGGDTDEELRALLDSLQRIVTEPALLPVFVFDVSRGVVPPARQRQMMGEWLRRYSGAIRRGCVGSAYVLPNPGLRGMLTAILWIAPHPVPHLVCKTAAEGKAWARQQLALTSSRTTP